MIPVAASFGSTINDVSHRVPFRCLKLVASVVVTGVEAGKDHNVVAPSIIGQA